MRLSQLQRTDLLKAAHPKRNTDKPWTIFFDWGSISVYTDGELDSINFYGGRGSASVPDEICEAVDNTLLQYADDHTHSLAARKIEVEDILFDLGYDQQEE